MAPRRAMPVRLGSLAARGDSTRQPDRDSESPLSRMACREPSSLHRRTCRSRFLRPLRHRGSAEHGSRGSSAHEAVRRSRTTTPLWDAHVSIVLGIWTRRAREQSALAWSGGMITGLSELFRWPANDTGDILDRAPAEHQLSRTGYAVYHTVGRGNIGSTM
ncbi:hypothetical protein MTO96_011614 [Rhipicephalus appendiculatus]